MRQNEGWKLKNEYALYPWQVVTYELASGRPRSCDWSEAGTGKSLPAITALLTKMSLQRVTKKGYKVWFKEKRNAMLITAPSAMIGWRTTWESLEPTFPVKFFEYHGTPKKRKAIAEEALRATQAGYQVIVMLSWGLLSNAKCFWEFSKLQKELTPHYYLLDEVQYMTNPEAARTNIMTGTYQVPKIRDDYPQYMLLSATPQSNGPEKAWELFAINLQDVYGANTAYPMGHYEFMNRHFDTWTDAFGRQRVSKFKDVEYYKKAFSFGAVLHERKTVYANRKDPVWSNFLFDLSDEHFNILATYMAMLEEKLAKRSKFLTESSFAKLMRERQLATDPEILGFEVKNNKLEKLIEVLKDHDVGHYKALVLCEFRHTFEKLMRELPKLGFPCAGIQGGMTIKARAEALDRFNQDPKLSVFVGIRPAMAEGVNLQVANVTVNYELNWALDKYIQGLGRTDRLGQNKQLYYVNLVARSTVDTAILRALRKRLEDKTILEEDVKRKTKGKLSEIILKKLNQMADEDAAMLERDQEDERRYPEQLGDLYPENRTQQAATL